MTDSPHLEYLMEGTRADLARFMDALKLAGITGHIRAKPDCAPTT